ncbi:MAG: hypothetical protein IRZ20_00155 [Thermoleophilia bacterium]|nr:hypothetical protein [Thermoleophilia bacterium]
MVLDVAADQAVQVGDPADVLELVQRDQRPFRTSRKQGDYANLIGAIGNTPKMRGIKAELEVIHNLRSEKSMEAHPGEPATAEDVTAARQHLKKVATVCLQLLEDAHAAQG